MGNCFKKSSFISDKYLFEPLTSEEEGVLENHLQMIMGYVN